MVLFLGCKSLQDAVANGDTRTISMRNIHTKENLTITYKRNGRYDDEAMRKISWFLRDWRKEQATTMDPQLIDLAWEVAREVDAQQPLEIICGYRSPETNAMLRRRSSGVAKVSQHSAGRAMDFFIPGARLEDLRNAGLRLQRGGVGFYPTSGSPFVHLDTGSVRHWPRIPEEQLAQIMSRSPRVQVAEAPAPRPAQPPRGLLASLFGGAGEDEPETTGATQQARAPMRTAMTSPRETKAAAEPVRLASPSVPMPQARPVRAIAEATAAVGPKAGTPSAIVLARGAWDAMSGGLKQIASDMVPYRIASAMGLAKPGPAAETPAGPVEAVEAVAVTTPAAEQQPLATVTFAYAAPDQAVAARPARGLFSPRKANAATGPIEHVKTTKGTIKPGAEALWFQAMVMAPDLQNFLSSTAIGMPDFKDLRSLMRKPSSALATAFSDDPQQGLSTQAFRGDAVVFLRTVTFATRTAQLDQDAVR